VIAAPTLALRPEQAAAALNVSRDFFDAHVAGELRWIRRGRLKIVEVAEISRWLSENAALTLEKS
jgi:hypothetical protein